MSWFRRVWGIRFCIQSVFVAKRRSLDLVDGGGIQLIVTEPRIDALHRSPQARNAFACCARGMKAWGDNASLFSFCSLSNPWLTLVQIYGVDRSRLPWVVLTPLLSCTVPFLAYFVLLSPPDSSPSPCLAPSSLSVSRWSVGAVRGWGGGIHFLLWHPDRHAALAHLPE